MSSLTTLKACLTISALEKGREVLEKAIRSRWEKMGFKKLDFGQFSGLWVAVHIAKVETWYLAFDTDGDKILSDAESEGKNCVIPYTVYVLRY